MLFSGSGQRSSTYEINHSGVVYCYHLFLLSYCRDTSLVSKGTKEDPASDVPLTDSTQVGLVLWSVSHGFLLKVHTEWVSDWQTHIAESSSASQFDAQRSAVRLAHAMPFMPTCFTGCHRLIMFSEMNPVHTLLCSVLILSSYWWFQKQVVARRNAIVSIVTTAGLAAVNPRIESWKGQVIMF
jgi:hypothetical protein